MWQKLFEDLSGQNFTVMAVALDEPEAARPWIEAASPSYPCVIDREHHVAELYHIVNVPQAAWIDDFLKVNHDSVLMGYSSYVDPDGYFYQTMYSTSSSTRTGIKSDRLDALLDKVHREGRASLTDEEERFMKRVSDRYRRSK